MADVLSYPGAGTNGGVPAPYLQGDVYPVGQGLGGRIALGMGRMTRRFADILSSEGGAALNEAQLQSLITAAAQQGAASQIINYNFDGMVGPPGPPGKTIVQYLPPVNGVGQVGRYGEDGQDAFANIDIPIPYDGWEGAFTNNSPGAGSVAWTSFKIKYQGIEHTIAAGNTTNEWLYWDSTATTVISSTATRTNAQGVGKWFVGRNNAGTFEQSQFIKLITSGFISVTALSALAADLGTVTAGTIVMNLGSTYRLRISASGIQGSTNSGSSYFDIIDLDGTDVIIHGTKLKIGSVGTNPLADDATKILTQSYGTGLGPLDAGADGLNTMTHASDGGSVKITLSCIVYNAAAGAVGTAEIALYYGGDLYGLTQTSSLGPGEFESVQLSAYVPTSDAGNNNVTGMFVRAVGNSTEIYINNCLLEAVEDKGK